MPHPTRSATPLRRLLGAAVIGTVALAPLGGAASAAESSEALPFAAADHDESTLDAIPIDWFCANVPADYDPFTDIGANAFRADIRCLGYGDIARGGEGGTAYRPATSISREQMASLVVRMMDTAKALERSPGQITALPAYDGINHFVDTDPASPHTPNVNRLRAAGIAMGGPDGLAPDRYGPGRSVTRGQMATFIARSLRHLVAVPEIGASGDYFTDDTGSPHEPNINLVAEVGIAVGRQGSTEFGYRQTLPRDQMAAFVTRTLAALEWETEEVAGWITPLPPR